MAEIEIEGRTVEEAIREGLQRLELPREQVEVKILNEGSGGLFGLMGSKPARVRLTTRAAASAADPARTQDAVRETLGNLLGMMGIPVTDIAVSLEHERVTARIASPDSALIIGRNGQTLDALDLIVNLMVAREPATRMKVAVDCDGHRARQEERLQAMARQAAESVLRSGGTYRFDPMPAADRRVLHTALKDDARVETFSEGEGALRRVGVRQKQA